MDRGMQWVTLALIVGVAAGVAARVTSAVSPYAVQAVFTALQSRKKKEAVEFQHNASTGAVAKTHTIESNVSKLKEGDAYKDAIRRALLSWKDIEERFQNFPYYLDDSTKSQLIDSAFVYLKRPEFSKYTSRLGSVSSRILLTGPPGSEIYQEGMVRALAHHLEVNLLIFDSTRLYLDVSESVSRRLQRSAEDSSSTNEVSADESVELPVDVTRDGMRGEGSSARVDHRASSSDAEPESRSLTAGQTVCLSKRPRPSESDAIGLGLLLEGEAEEDTETLVTAVTTAATTTAAPIAAPTAAPIAATDTVSRSPPSSPLPQPEARRIIKRDDGVMYVGNTLSGSFRSAIVPNQVQGGPPSSDLRPPVGARGRVLGTVRDKVGVRFERPFCGGGNLNGLCEDGLGFFCSATEIRLEYSGSPKADPQKLVMESLLEVLQAYKEPLILFIRNAEKSIVCNTECYLKLERMVSTADAKLVVIGAHTAIPDQQKKKGGAFVQSSAAATSTSGLFSSQQMENTFNILRGSDPFLDQLALRARMEEYKGNLEGVKAARLLPKFYRTNIQLGVPEEEGQLSEWNRLLEKDTEKLQAEANRQQLRMVMGAMGVDCHDLAGVEVRTQLTRDMSEKVVYRGVSHHLQTNPEPVLRNGRLLIAAESLQHNLQELRSVLHGSAADQKTLKDVVCDNEHEKMLLREVIPPEKVGVTFDHIGALDNVKETLRELVMLPLQRPELFLKGQLTKPCRGLLLFGPPGTGKTMLAKAVATEAGANFINVSMSTIASRWIGEGEKTVKALFTIASKISPSVIFIDEVDSMLGQRGKDTEHAAMRKLKNEFMASWDGLRTREKERVLVMAATNRPFDLDEAVIRRFPRRLMVDLPDATNRSKILRVILAEEDLSSDFSLEEMANASAGYSGSDLKSLCTTAAYLRIQEFLEKEKEESQKAKEEGIELPPPLSEAGSVPFIRPINMSDMRQAMEKVRPSVPPDAESMRELHQWNGQYGEGGKRRKSSALSYFM